MKKTNIILAGYGRVGQAFIRLVQEKQDFCLKRYHLQIGIGVVLVDCTPSNIQDGEPALGYAHQALDRGWHA